MRSIRYFVFETNSSSTHSLTLDFSDRKFTRTDKLLPNNVYTHKLMGEKKDSSEVSKCSKHTYSSEYDKLCVLFDMLFMHFYTQFFNLRNNAEYLEQYRKRKSEDNESLYLRMVLDKTIKSYEYLDFIRVLKRHNIKFKVNKDEYAKSDTEYLYFDYSGYYFDFLEYVKMFGFRTIEEAVEKIVFDSKYIFSLYSSCSY